MNDAARNVPERIRLRRFRQNARYDLPALFDVLDTGVVCHVGFISNCIPMVIPTLYWRDDSRIYFHGSTAGQMLKAIEGKNICLTVTHLDGLVLTRSAFHHSANYRSAVVIGRPTLIASHESKERSLKGLMDAVFPERWETLRPIARHELNATKVFSLPMDEFTVKSRYGPPVEDSRDLTWPAWAGVIPIVMNKAEPVPDPTAQQCLYPVPHLSKFNAPF